MNKQPTRSNPTVMLRFSKTTFMGLLSALGLISSVQTSQSGSATWSATPRSSLWNVPNNWTPRTIPNGPNDTATFASSSVTAISLGAMTTVYAITFDSTANAYTLLNQGVELTISGTGITNDSSSIQDFIVSSKSTVEGVMNFTGHATAGNSSRFRVKGGTPQNDSFGELDFYNTATAGSAALIVSGASAGKGNGGFVSFNDSATADNATITVNGGTAGTSSGISAGGYFYYRQTAPAALNGNFTINGGTRFGLGGYAEFDNDVTFNGNLTLNSGVAYSGQASFFGPSVTINGSINVNGASSDTADASQLFFELTGPAHPGVGSITVNGGQTNNAKAGYVELDSHDAGVLTYTANGGNGQNAEGGIINFSNTPGENGTLIANGGTNNGGGGLIQISGGANFVFPTVKVFGNGTVDLTQASQPYLGSIEGDGIIKASQLAVVTSLDTTFSGTLSITSLTVGGSGTLTLTNANIVPGEILLTGGTLLIDNVTSSTYLEVPGGTLGGTGTVNYDFTLIVGGGIPNAFLAPGHNGIGVLTLGNALEILNLGNYICELDSDAATADQISANGVSLDHGSHIILSDRGTTTLPSGTIFTVISNYGSRRIQGIFDNLSDGTMIAVGNNTYLVNYGGGSGNDLTLTVVP
jgi:hypothetical protein